jgi:hypothetical protein
MAVSPYFWGWLLLLLLLTSWRIATAVLACARTTSRNLSEMCSCSSTKQQSQRIIKICWYRKTKQAAIAAAGAAHIS